jgi:hypothetical protein
MGAFIGPPLGEILIAFGVPAPFDLDAVSFPIAAGSMFYMSIASRSVAQRPLVWGEASETLTWMRGYPVILQLALMLRVMNGLEILCTTVLVLFAQEILGLNVPKYGVLLLWGAVGE